MRLFRRHRCPPPAPAVGIRLRISGPAGPLVDATSEHLYYVAKFGEVSTCGFSCLPGCSDHGWVDLMPATLGNPVLRFEIKPVTFAVPLDEELIR